MHTLREMQIRVACGSSDYNDLINEIKWSYG